MLKRIYDILYAFKEYVLLAVLLTLSIGLIASNERPQIRAIRSVTVGVLGSAQNLIGIVPNYFNLRSENRILREQNLTLSEEVNRLREARLENIRLRRLLGMRDTSGTRYIAARVIGKSLQLLRNTITINIGERDGIRPLMPVVTERGLVGKVVATSKGYSVAQVLLHRDMRVSGKVQRSRADGIVAWEGGSTLVLRNIAKTLDVQAGDVVMTSEYSSLYPAGIRIGTVALARQVPGSLFQNVELVPAVDFATLEEVFVIPVVPDSTRLALEASFQR
ncbi:MAG: mreC [Bacteroidetes bacterium]|jgi:rod shape-determining protein MreC|nr:mreC [Bacteroidota bacterium]